jgi:hypothetical protein
VKAKTRREICELFYELAAQREAEQQGQAAFERECREASTPPPDHEADFQDFLGCYRILERYEAIARIAYMVGIADAQTHERQHDDKAT